jgi:hypothetical protein
MTVPLFNKVRYLFGMNNQLTLSRTEIFFYLKSLLHRRFSLRCCGKVFQWLLKDWHKKVSDFCKMKFVHVHFAADWMNKFPIQDTRSHWFKYIFVTNEYTANVIYCSPQLFIFIEPINTQTCCKSVTNFCHVMLYQVHLTMSGFELTTLVVIGTDCIGSCKSRKLLLKASVKSESNGKLCPVMAAIFVIRSNNKI